MLPRTRRLRSSDVERVLKAGFSLAHPPLRAKAQPRPSGATVSRYAVVVSKKVAGTAVVRNKLRRMAFAALEHIPPTPPHDVVVMVTKVYVRRRELAQDIEVLLARLVRMGVRT